MPATVDVRKALRDEIDHPLGAPGRSFAHSDTINKSNQIVPRATYRAQVSVSKSH